MMQAQDLFPQVQKLVIAEQLTLLNFLVQLIQQEVLSSNLGEHSSITSVSNLAQPVEATTTTVPTVLERMGGMPQHLLSVGGLSDRDQRRQLVAERIQARYRLS